MGRSDTSWPRAISCAARALSRRQLPQYMPPAPAVIWRIRTRYLGRPRPSLQRAPDVEVLEQVALVGLVPAHLITRYRAQVEPVEVRCAQHARGKGGVVGDRGDREGRTEARRDLLRANRHDTREGEQELAVGERMVR